MTTIRASDFLNAASSQMALLQRALKENEETQSQHQSQIKSLETTRAGALDELAALYLPALTPEAFAPLPALTGYRQFEVSDPFAQMEQRRVQLSARIAAIESDERYTRRVQLLDPTAGELTLKFADAEKEFNLFNDSLARYENEPEFSGLVERGYDTDDYQVSWLTLRYYRDWKYGDIIAEKFGQQKFREVLDAYLQLREAREVARQEFLVIKKQKDEVEGLTKEREQAISGLLNLEADTLNACRRQLRDHLEYIDRQELAKWSAADSKYEGLIKRIHGIEKKIEYLDELAKRYLSVEHEQLMTMLTKLNAKMSKYSRPKHAHTLIPVEEANRWIRDPSEKLSARRMRFSKNYERVYYFDRYNAYDYARDMLWWDLMTDGRIDGDFIPEVQSWREQHPRGNRILESDTTIDGSDYPAQGNALTGLESMTDVS